MTAAAHSRSSFLARYWRLVLLSLIGWSLLAAIPTTSAYLGTGAPGMPVWWAMFKKIGFYYYLWGLTAPLLYRMTDALPYRGSSVLLTVAAHLAAFATLTFAFGFVSHYPTWHDWLIGPRAPGYHAMSFFTYALIVLCCMAVKFYRLSLLRQREAAVARISAAELDNQLNIARVDSLRRQMNPHFLFNALNSIAALIDSDRKERAYEATEQLGDLLRQALNLSEASDVSVEQELAFCSAYLEMEQLRFGERLKVQWAISDDTLAWRIPAFILQPLIENAIKHAVSRSAGAVVVEVSAGLEQESLRFSVCDDGAAPDNPHSKGGLGIANLRERLRLRFGAAVQVVAERRTPGFCASIDIPVRLISTGDTH